MLRNERLDDATVAFIAAFEGMQAGLWTALPGIVDSYDPARGTVNVVPGVKVRRRMQDGTEDWVAMPVLPDVPVVFPGGGGFVLSFPLQAGDPVLVVFANRSIDAWWDSGEVSVQNDARMHDLSDGFALPGPRPRPQVHPGMSTSGAELRAASRSSYVRIDDDGNVNVLAAGDIVAMAGGDAFVTAAHVTVQGDVTIIGTLNVTGLATLAGDVSTPQATIGGVAYNTHKHSDPQGGLTGGPQ